jgi:hypothetical protein
VKKNSQLWVELVLSPTMEMKVCLTQMLAPLRLEVLPPVV